MAGGWKLELSRSMTDWFAAVMIDETKEYEMFCRIGVEGGRLLGRPVRVDGDWEIWWALAADVIAANSMS